MATIAAQKCVPTIAQAMAIALMVFAIARLADGVAIALQFLAPTIAVPRESV